MAELWQAGVQVLKMSHGSEGNYVLAHLQTAAFERFEQCRGFFITFFGGTDNDGRPSPTSSLWCSPQAQLRFVYDEYDKPIEIDPELVDLYSRAMKDPIGVVIAPPSGTDRWPFTLLKTERPAPLNDEQPI